MMLLCRLHYVFVYGILIKIVKTKIFINLYKLVTNCVINHSFPQLYMFNLTFCLTRCRHAVIGMDQQKLGRSEAVLLAV